MPTLTVQQIADLCEGTVSGNPDLVIVGASSLDDAQGSDLAFVDNAKAAILAARSRAGCLLVRQDFRMDEQRTIVRVEGQPRLAFARVLKALYKQSSPQPQIHRTAIVSETATVPKTCFVGPYSTIGDGTILGEGCVIGSGCTIAANVILGDACLLHDRVVIYQHVHIGARAILHAGCVLGADGFGFAMAGDHYEKFPQVGTVKIGDDVEIGANSCVDRAALGSTRIGNGTKLDNLVHVAHNCVIGKHVVVAAQTGFSGSVFVGDYAVIGGQVGIADKAHIASKSVIGAQAGIVSGQRIEAGEAVWGTPARPIKQHLKGLAYVGKLSEAFDRLKELEEKVRMLESAFGND